jgi:hypothetical protein
VHALRKDGFSGDIALALKNAPAGFVLSGGLLPAGQDQVRVTLTVPPQARMLREPVSVRLEGRASIEGREVTRAAVPADDMMQAFFYRHLVPAEDLKVAVRRATVFRSPVQVSATQPLKIPAGGEVRLQAQVPLLVNNQVEKVIYELSDPPPGVELREAAGEIVLRSDAAKAKPGQRGNLIIQIAGERKPAGESRPQANRQRIPLGVLPAIPFEIVRDDTRHR